MGASRLLCMDAQLWVPILGAHLHTTWAPTLRYETRGHVCDMGVNSGVNLCATTRMICTPTLRS